MLFCAAASLAALEFNSQTKAIPLANSQFPRRYNKSVQKQFNVRLRVEQWIFLAASLLILGGVISWPLKTSS
jgi:hypothetical protein